MFLDDATASARNDMEIRKRSISFTLMQELAIKKPGPPSFMEAIRRGKGEPVNVIAEIKRSSPSRGFIKNGFSVEELTRTYVRGGAAAVSVLTEAEYFKGSMLDLSAAAGACGAPILRKDFMVDPYQVLESRYLGASSVLLIVAALPGESLRELLRLTGDLGMEALVEVHDELEMERALEAGAEIVGINNRDLKTLEIDIGVTERLLPLLPRGRVVVGESGVSNRRQAKRLEDAGVDAILVGEALMLADDPAARISELRGDGTQGGQDDAMRAGAV